ncbi:hypothetical protein H2198_001570 [Neophaeococcomyces mojaviensis]|uniref:Uncharacterized protein n=1 Tax=Neophaeococcomyces mojaviensis TaxID=3383035 RepID=A0ACC3AGY1_9EURO|nr:hypothetical protein H2198_001570 [Knufia sp. JES_112]
MDNKHTPTAVAAASTGTFHRRTSSGISDDAATSAHEFMAGNIRRSSSGVTDDAAKAAREFVRLAQAQSKPPGLNDDLVDKTHKFLDGNATNRTSHSKHLPDVTIPGMTDQILEEALEFEDSVEKSGK